MESIYLLIEREFLKSDCPIYKIGRSSQENDTRIKQYPKGSRLICLINVEDSKFMEKEIFSLFKHKYIQRKDIGSEYFEGKMEDMRRDIFDMVMEYDCVGVLECKKLQQGLKKLVLKELIKKINNGVTTLAVTVTEVEAVTEVMSEAEISPIVNLAVPIVCPKASSTFIKTAGRYTCESCDYSTSSSWLYGKHLKTTKHIALLTTETAEAFRHVCKKCSRKYSSESGLRKHNIKCASRIKPEEDIVLPNQLATGNENVEFMRSMMCKLKEEIQTEIRNELIKEFGITL